MTRLLLICFTFVILLGSATASFADEAAKKDCVECRRFFLSFNSVLGIPESLFELAMTMAEKERGDLTLPPLFMDRPLYPTDRRCERPYLFHRGEGRYEIPSECFRLHGQPLSKEKPLKDRLPIYIKSDTVGYKGIF